MRTTLKQSLATLAALAALMLSGTACTQDDPLGNNPAGTALLALGEVTIAGAETAPAPGTTRSAAANGGTTRADASGFTGIRKSSFIAGDELVLTLTDDKDVAAAPVTAKLNQDNTTWTLPKTYFTAGTTLSATYSPATQPGGITYKDDLTTGANPVKLPTDGTKATITLLHANALVEVTPPKNIVCTDLTISATPAGTDADPTPTAVNLGVAQQGSTANSDLRYLTIAPADSKLGTISLKVNGMTYTTTLNPEVQVEANKRYPIALTINGDKLEATVATSTDWGNSVDVDGFPAGYDYYIRTIADLEKFRDDVNADAAGTGARSAAALQTADIDMTGVAWEPIGSESRAFSGSYNGNGHSISNLTMNKTYTSGTNDIGLFGFIEGANITGVHLRNCTVTASGGVNICAGTLIGRTNKGCIITLCSATGSVSVTGVTNAYAGGLVGFAIGTSTSTSNHFTRCTADVAVTTNATTGGYTCAFTGCTENGYYAGCIASGKVTLNGAKGCSGFSYAYKDKNDVYHAIGCIVNSEVVDAVNNDILNRTAFGGANTLKSCFATGTYTYLGAFGVVNTDNAFLNALTASGSAGITPAEAWGVLTKSNVASMVPIKTLHYSKKDGYTTDVVERYWYAKGIWKDNGTDLPTIDMSYEGGAVPIIPGNNVYSVNGYWVTAPESEIESYLWTTGNYHEATMTPDPCAAGASNGWRMPIMKDFEAMLGWTGTHNWDKEITNNQYHNIADATNFTKAFPAGDNYWSSTHNSIAGLTTNAWCLRVNADGTEGAYSSMSKSNRNLIRCVQKIAPTP